jgi:molybdate transport system substrate-binding protein
MHLLSSCLLLALLVLPQGGCRSGPSSSSEPLRVFAAASLTNAFRETAAAYEANHRGERVELQFGGSQMLRVQIERGARADVFAAADWTSMDALVAAGLVRTPQPFAGNNLVLVWSRARSERDSAAAATLEGIASPGVRVVLAEETVPIGRYTREVLRKAAASPRFGPDFVRRVHRNVMSRETNVRAVLAKVAIGEADAGFVYRTDALSAGDSLIAVEIPSDLNVTASYPIAVVTGSANQRRASALVAEVLGPWGQAVFRRHGFLPPP